MKRQQNQELSISFHNPNTYDETIKLIIRLMTEILSKEQEEKEVMF